MRFKSAFKGLKLVAVVVYICLSLWSCFLFIFFLMQSLVFGGMLTHSVCCLLLSFFLWSLFASQEFVPTLDSELPLNNSNAEVAEKKLISVVCDSAFPSYLSCADTFWCEWLGNADFFSWTFVLYATWPKDTVLMIF
jgi:hypothetical protein